ncbi:hypothetical protein VTL71DRAFT_7048 [Oculimacula yallundae]|uniref:Uncharacterized protein n=1 Tax=Oculimacula yallundae TaxID=86028 RepID=A0ABR4BWR6_9HELO
MASIIKHVRIYWAKRIGSSVRSEDRISVALRKSWPKAKIGWLSPNSNTVIEYNATQPEVEYVLEAFEAIVDDGKPFFGFFFEYLECVGS